MFLRFHARRTIPIFFALLTWALFGSLPAYADGTEQVPQSAYTLAIELVDRAYQNPAVLNDPFARAIQSVRDLMPYQNFQVVVGTPLERSCFGHNVFTGKATEFGAFALIDGCTQNLVGIARSPKVCTIGVCRPGLELDSVGLAHTLIHEMGHVIQGRDECFATALSMHVFRLAGLAPKRDGYTNSCGLQDLLKSQ